MRSGKVMVIGGTKGLGHALACKAAERGLETIVMGRGLPPVGKYDYERLDISKPSSLWDRVMDLAEGGDMHLFWVAGIYVKKPLHEMAEEEVAMLVRTHVSGPFEFLRRFHRRRVMSRSPYHLTTVASTSIFKRRAEGGETAYCGTKAAQAAFTAAHAIEMSRALPGSAALLVNPGRMRSGQQDPAKAGKHLDVGVVAQRIWHEIDGQAASYLEMNIWPDGNGDPCVTYGPEMPQRY